MAKRKRTKAKATFNVTGLSISDIANIDPSRLNKMNKADLKRVVTRLNSAGNKRLKRLRNSFAGTMSPAYRFATGKNGRRKFSVRNKTRNQLLKEYSRVRDFLFNKKTASVSGWKKTRKGIEDIIERNLPKKKAKKFWSVYRKFVEARGGAGAIRSMKYSSSDKDTSDRILKLIAKEFLTNKKSEEDVLRALEAGVTREYEELQDKQNEDSNYKSLGRFFEFSD